MRSLFFLTLSVVFITGCSDIASTPSLPSKEAKQIIKTAQTVKKEAPKQKESIKPKTPPMDETRYLPDHKDLFAEYKSAIIKTTLGDITVQFYPESPVTVNNFLNLAQQGFYDGTTFHRIIKDFMIQGGDPLSKDQTNRLSHGTGGPGYSFADEFNDRPLIRGNIAMANSGPNTNGSQFFIVTAAGTPWLNGKHTNFGILAEGSDVLNAIEAVETDERDNPLEPVVITSIELVK